MERCEIEGKVLELARSTFKEPDMALQSVLNEASGYDSMAHVQLLVDIEDWCGVVVNDNEVRRDDALQAVVDLVERKLQEKA